MELLADYALFLAKTVTVVIAVVIALAAVTAVPARLLARREQITVRHLNQKYRRMGRALEAGMAQERYRWKVRRRGVEPKAEPRAPAGRRIFVLTFHGDLRASAIGALREEITAVLMASKGGDEVALRLESFGGLVSAYGLAASQLLRIKQHGLRLTVLTDRIAASGGYMMAAVADRIVAAPFAIVGSIGVIAQLPNFHRFLKKHDIDFEQFMAGDYKRTVTLFGENTDRGKAKMRQEVEQTHDLFKAFLAEQRPQLEVDAVATGEYWYGRHALERRLVDELRTSDDFLLAASATAELYEVRFKGKRESWLSRFAFDPSGSRLD